MSTIMFKLDEREGAFEIGTTYEQAIEALWPSRALRPLAVSINGKAAPLDFAPQMDTTATILDYSKDEGRRIYERSVRFLFLIAARAVFPGAQVRIEHSVHHGIYANIDIEVTDADIDRLQAHMQQSVDEALRFGHVNWTREQALEFFKAQNQTEKYRLLLDQDNKEYLIYQGGGMSEHFYGVLTPSADYLKVFKLQRYAAGIVVQLPASATPDRIVEREERPKLMRTFDQSARWSRILHCSYVADLNDMIRSNQIRDFIRVNEALHEKSIADIADQIVKSGARVVLIAGPSSSGKTTFANRLAIHLRVNGKRPVMLSLDEYYRNRTDVPLDEDGSPDLECLEALNVPLLNEQLAQLIAGQAVTVPHFDFHSGLSSPGHTLQVQADQPLLIEGIHGLNPKLSASLPEGVMYRIYISALTTLNLDRHNRTRTTDVRLIRRMVRDHQFRNSPIERTLSMWPSVRRGEEQYIFPYQEEADVMFNSTLHYELAILKPYIYPLLKATEPNGPYAPTVNRLINFLNFIDVADAEDEIGPTSIMREFIGGCTFYRG